MDLQLAASVALLFVVVAFVTPLAWRLVMLVVHANRMDRITRAEAMAKLQATMAECQRSAERVKAVAPVLARPSYPSPPPHMLRPVYAGGALRELAPEREPRLEFDMFAANGYRVHLENGA